MRIIKLLFASFLYISAIRAGYWQEKPLDNEAVVVVPLADMVGMPFESLGKSTEEQYSAIPFCWYGNNLSCLRIHQLIFNEVVKIVDEKDNQIKCQLPNTFYYAKDGSLRNEFWTHKKYLLFLKELQNSPAMLFLVPPPYAENFTIKEFNKNTYTTNILTLIKPWQDPLTDIVYSAGTRFVYLEKEQVLEGSFIINIIDYIHKTITVAKIPKEYATINYDNCPTTYRYNFLKVLRLWASYKTNKISYVHGGCSFIDTYDPSNIHVVTNERGSYWDRTAQPPYSGYDCSGLLLRAAQACGLPYFFKNTVTIHKFMRPLKNNELPQEGDIIWFFGHILVINRLEPAECIEAGRYESGEGAVHILRLSEIFENIRDFNQLHEAYTKQIPLKLLHRDSTVRKEISELVIFSLDSIYDKVEYH